MLIDNITEYCNNRYLNRSKCKNCSYDDNCPGDCGICLQYIHFPNSAPEHRKYDCPNMANFYVCKYSHKYMSELVYALSRMKDLKKKKEVKVLSIGCGPCTDLFALDFLKKEGIYKFDSIEYRGIDYSQEVWENIHNEIKCYNKKLYTAKFFYKDTTEFVNTIVKAKWVPDLIVFQYVFSDMKKHCPTNKLNSFISKIAYFFNGKMDANTYMLLNDINLSTAMGGGREYFDQLLYMITDGKSQKLHFDNSNRPSHYHYGVEYSSNELVLDNPDYLDSYEPFDSCASAQLIIKKVTE